MATTKNANHGKEQEATKKGNSSSNDNKSKGSMGKSNKSDSKSHK